VPGRELLLAGGAALIGVGILLILLATTAPRLLTVVWRWGGLTVVFPLGLCIVLSIVLTVVLNLLLRAR
jgi:Protein of unknown function (DUF2905)